MPDSLRPADPKAAIRAGVLAARRLLGPERLASNAARVRAALLASLPGLRPAGSPVAAHVPMPSEPGGPGLPETLRRALGPAIPLLLPVLRDDLGLDWAPYHGTLVPGRQGPLEPPGPGLGPAAVAAAPLILVPALAVDRRGVRLGRGGGSYDRALAYAAGSALVVALLHDGELRADDLPVEPHDRRVSAVITPAAGFVVVPPA